VIDDEPMIDESPERWVITHDREYSELVGTVSDALAFALWNWPKSVVGTLRSMRRQAFSEYELVWSGELPRLARYLRDILVPSLPGRAPGWLPPPLSMLLFHRSEELAPEGEDPFGRFAGEEWFFINGILTNQDVARINAAYLVELFQRPVRVMWNSTDGLLVDLLECASEKLGATGEDVDSAFPVLLQALADPAKRRVVLISHSQGTLITAVLLRLIRAVHLQTLTGTPGVLTGQDRELICRQAAAAGLRVDPAHVVPIGPDELATLELYCFANCATEMRYIDRERSLPRIESYGNEHDLVARLGMLAPYPRRRRIEIDGPRFRRDGAWGHLLDAHYLVGIDRARRASEAASGSPYVAVAGTAPDGAVPHLFRYLDGGEALGAPQPPDA
jgi:hypothetical protein